ncbi:nuclear distribution protein-like protein nude [Plenodomus tracheiphilus IPT5]|uniref:Nuclear distribution protein-like protein nude n=1 Tax=Plenodomus tracheiphilus IPT5 TaxID=1408161 RepID=A0A6A7BHG8_9PLEO|nr:nuclear distribution protein-like protein nude [Plenodomus tracheiphilus IPT5]
MASDMTPSSPPSGGWGSMQEELAYYKSQYETLDAELQEFQTSSKELEAELERDVEESEKRERKLQEKAERLEFDVEEWKAKYKQSKTEANNAQNTLQKEITTLRDSQRTLQLRLRDIEVQSDEHERQARNQTSSLEDVESKYNVAIERGVMLEEELRIGEQEREALRIETQRLRDELSDLRIETEIVQEKLRVAEATIERFHQRKVSNHLASDALRPRSPISEASTTTTTLSSPTTASTPPHSKTDALLPETTPPSPPLSDAPLTTRRVPSTPMPRRKASVATIDPAATPRAGAYSSRAPRHSRGPSVSTNGRQIVGSTGRTTPSIRTTAPQRAPRPSMGGAAAPTGLPRSGSLVHIRGLIGQMQKLEVRVKSARSKLPAPTSTPPRASPRNGSAMGNHVPSTVTLRSTRKRTSHASTASSINEVPQSGVSRLSFGVSSSREPSNSRPSSRASMSSASGPQRPGSRSSNRTPLGHYQSGSISGIEGRLPRPRSSMSGIINGHGHSNSLSMSLRDCETGSTSDGSSATTPMGRRVTMDKTGIPTPSGLPRRQSAGRRASASGFAEGGGMGPPAKPRKMSTYSEEETF